MGTELASSVAWSCSLVTILVEVEMKGNEGNVQYCSLLFFEKGCYVDR
jgi:hypothetical protein